MSRPVIGISTSARFSWSWPFLAFSVWLAGGSAVRITPDRQRVDLDALDGLLVGGGDDIGAELYGATPVLNTRIDPARDAMEVSLLERFWGLERFPILGVCRGAQIMNVFRGGTLHGDIYEVYVAAPKMRTVLPKKLVDIEPGSHLERIVGVGELTVNSLHHQSVDRLGQGLTIAARESNGVVQAVEAAGEAFRIGVQWHPEFLFFRSAHARLFRCLIEAAKPSLAAERAAYG